MLGLHGAMFGRLTVETYAGRDEHSNRKWNCLCECGSSTVSLEYNLVSGKSQSCGCVSGVRVTHPITYSQLRALFIYDPETGFFTRRRAVRGGVAGDVVGDFNAITGYVSVQIAGKRYAAHRLAHLYMTGTWPPEQVDHRARVRSDNRWRGLRPATSAQNHANSGLRSDNTSGYRGVSRSGNRWAAYGSAGRKTVNLGSFETPEAAAARYDKWAIEQFGEFASPNFPTEIPT